MNIKNDKKICFITCVNDRSMYNECLYYIQQLKVPEGYEMECIAVENASSMTQGYNKAMSASDAKYKVYLHQDVFITNKNFIQNILSIFTATPNAGMLGVAGAKVLPTNGIWWESSHKYGKVYDSHTGKMELLKFKEPKEEYEKVQAIDGLLMVTQYDIPWREDLFDGWHFYDISQSIEFVKEGYEVIIPSQEKAWCIHDCGVVNVKNGYGEYRNIFLDEYSKNIFPLVSILIPAYNQTEYLKEALESAINQTYSNIEIIIGDDSTNDSVKEFVKPYLAKYKNIIYFKNKRDVKDYGYINHINCFIKSHGEYINYLNHDDILHPKKIEYMMNYFIQNPNVTLVTSARQPIDKDGNLLPTNGAFTKLFDKDTALSGYELSRIVAKNLINVIGEPTTVLFKKRYIDEGKYGYFNGVRFRSISDVAMWFTLLQYGDAVYISEPLSYFRMHADQNSNKSDVFIHGIVAWHQLIKHSYEVGILQNIDEYKLALNKWLISYIPALNNFIKKYDYVNVELKEKLTSSYEEAIYDMIHKDVIYDFECPICKNKVEKFLPYQYKNHKLDSIIKFEIIGSDTDNFTCPHCYCHDRMRHIVMYFNRLDIWANYIVDKRILHIAPEIHLQKIIAGLKPKKYVCGDLIPTNDSIKKIDITSIPFEDDYFDFIMCNHVLEHILNDLKAMKELYRVLKKGGYAVLQTPYSPIIEKSFEDISKNSDEERKEYFGQEDHVRIYGLDFFERLKIAGFKLRIVRNNELFTREECKKYGFNHRENLILVSK